jgi:hypothetical protein
MEGRGIQDSLDKTIPLSPMICSISALVPPKPTNDYISLCWWKLEEVLPR